MKTYRDASKISRASKMECYKSGGRVHDDAAEDRAMVRSMVKPTAMKAGGGPIEGGGTKRRMDRKGPKSDKGGEKKSGKVNVNIIVANPGKDAPGAGPMPIAPPPKPMIPPAGPPPMPPPGPPLPPMRKHGGRITAGAATGAGRKQIGRMAK